MRNHRLALAMLATRMTSRTFASMRWVAAAARVARTRPSMILCLVGAIVTISHVDAWAQWSLTGSMSTPRAGSTATLLPNGQVLVSGGSDGTAWLASTEIYDPATGLWRVTAAMSIPRGYHSATLLSNGRVLVTGGVSGDSLVTASGDSLATAEIYDPVLDTWSLTGSTSTERAVHQATPLPDGRVLVTGGGYDPNDVYYGMATAEIYDPALGTWSPTGSMRTPRVHHRATLLSDGRVLVSGGHNQWGSSLASAEVYDPVLGTWSLTGSMSTDRASHGATPLSDGRVIVSGGRHDHFFEDSGESWRLNSAEIYDPSAGTWSPTGTLTTARMEHTATLLADGRVLLSGDWENPEIYNPVLGTWSLTGSMSTYRYLHQATLLSDGRVLVSGGRVAWHGAYLASAEIYPPGAGDDTTGPEVSCATANGAWQNSDVTIACTASDLGSGLVNSADASFNLTTNVPAGTEAPASTNSRQVCDIAGNCSTAGPITGNKVDKKGPTITIASPIASATYRINAKVVASYACVDGGSGMTSCAGPVANGSLFNTSSMGTKTFVVTATDSVGNSSALTVTYTVAGGKK